MNTFVKAVKQREVVIQLKGSNELQSIPCSIVVWATGIKARPLTNRIREIIGLNFQTNRMGILTDRYLRAKGVNDGSIFAIGDCATIEQPKLVDRIQLLFEEVDTQHRGALDLQQFRSLVEQKINEFPQVFIRLKLSFRCYYSNFSWKYSQKKLKKHLKKLIKRNQVF
jgi:NADH dehydrogenase